MGRKSVLTIHQAWLGVHVGGDYNNVDQNKKMNN